MLFYTFLNALLNTGPLAKIWWNLRHTSWVLFIPEFLKRTRILIKSRVALLLMLSLCRFCINYIKLAMIKWPKMALTRGNSSSPSCFVWPESCFCKKSDGNFSSYFLSLIKNGISTQISHKPKMIFYVHY